MATQDGDFVTAEGLAEAIGQAGGGGATLLWSGSSPSTVTIDSLQDYSLIVCILYDYELGGGCTFAIGRPDGKNYYCPRRNGGGSVTIGPTTIAPSIFQLRYVYGIK